MKTFEYRLYVNKEQAHLLMACLATSRQIYNRGKTKILTKLVTIQKGHEKAGRTG
jgi:hypothetical protein